jgi:hypothetical protein
MTADGDARAGTCGKPWAAFRLKSADFSTFYRFQQLRSIAAEAIFHFSESPIYIGKAEDSANSRPEKHRRQLEGRAGIVPSETSFRHLHFAHAWDAFKPESKPILLYSLSRNFRGFGPNDPGRRRGKTRMSGS